MLFLVHVEHNEGDIEHYTVGDLHLDLVVYQAQS